MSDGNTIVYLATDDPEASYREVVELLIGAWARVAPPEVRERVRAAIGPWTGPEGETIDPLVDGGTTGIVLPAAALDPRLAGEAGIQISCRPIWSTPEDPGTPPVRIGRAIDVLLYPVPTLGGPDLSGVVTLTALALAIGGQEVTRRGWAWALAIPGTSWVIGRPEVPGLTYGIGAAEEPKPARGVTAWREAQRQRLEAARQVVAASAAADGQDTTA